MTQSQFSLLDKHKELCSSFSYAHKPTLSSYMH